MVTKNNVPSVIKKPLRTLWKSTARLRHQTSLRWAFAMNRHEGKQPLFLLARQRTGGNMVLDYLRSIPGVAMAHEFLNPVFYYGFRPREGAQNTLLRHVQRSINYLDGDCCGCKILIGQFPLHGIQFSEFDAGLKSESRYLVLYRRDVLRQFVSLKIAHQTKQYLAHASKHIRTTDVAVDMDELEDLYRLNAAEYRSVLSCPGVSERCLAFAYEDVVADPQRMFADVICPFIEKDSVTVSTRLVKQSKRGIEETVTNYKEIEDRLEKYRNFDPYHTFD